MPHFSIVGLSGIGTTSAAPAVVGDFMIVSNPALPACDVDAVIATIDGRNPGFAFGVPPVNSGNAACGGQNE